MGQDEVRSAALAFASLRLPLHDVYKTLAHRWPETPKEEQEEEVEEAEEEEEEEKEQAAGGRMPDWLWQCRKVLGENTKKYATSDGHWDAYVIGVVVIHYLTNFLPYHLPHVSCDAAASEVYRNRVVHVQHMRNSVAHPPAPTAAECLAGLGAMLEVLKVHEEHAVVTKLQPLLNQLQTIATLPLDGPPSSIELRPDELTLWALEAAMQHFGNDLGKAIHKHSNQKIKPELPMEVSGICKKLQGDDGHNKSLEAWAQYWNLIEKDKCNELVAALEMIGTLRNQLNHTQRKITRDDVRRGIDAMIAVQAMLGLPTLMLLEVALRLVTANGLMTVEADTGAMHIPFKESREYCVARDDLIKDVVARLKASGRKIEVLYGESGAGKTNAAIAVAYKLFKDLPVQLFMQGSSVAQLRTELAGYARLHISGIDENENDDELVYKAHEHLAARTGWLLLVDDVGVDLQGVLDLLPVNKDGALVGHVILTSQDRSAWPETVRATEVHATEVGELGLDKAMDFLRQGEKEKLRVHEDVLKDAGINLREYIENQLGSLVLDVALLKNALKGIEPTSAAEIVRQWRTDIVESLETAQDMREAPRRSLRRRMGTVRELMRRLKASCEDDKKVALAARSLLAMCSVLDPAGVPSVLFTGGATKLSDLPGADLFRDGELYARAALALVDVGLVHDDSGRVLTLTMHQLVQTCVRHELRRGEVVGLREASTVVGLGECDTLYEVLRERYVDTAMHCAVIDVHAKRKLAMALHTCALAIYRCRCEGLTDTMKSEADLALAAEGSDKAGLSNALWPDGYKPVSRLLDELRRSGKRNLSVDEFLRVAFTEQRCSIIEKDGELFFRDKDEDEDEEAEAEEKAEEEEEAEAEEEEGGGRVPLLAPLKHAELGMAIGRRYYDAGGKSNWNEAIMLYKRALKIKKKLLGRNDIETVPCLNALFALFMAMGEYNEARKLCERALEITKKTQGPKHESVAVCLNNLGLLHKAMGNFGKALELLERALEIDKERLPDHPNTAATLNNLGTLHYDLGKYEKAREQYVLALKIYEKLNPNHPNTAMALTNLGGVLKEMPEHFDEALLKLTQARIIHEEELGTDHPNTASCLNTLGSLYQAMSEYKQAREQYERALEIRLAKLGPDHLDTAATFSGLGSLHYDMDKYEQARKQYEQAREIELAKLGPHHARTASSSFHLALVHIAMNKHGHAAKLLEELKAPEVKLPHKLTIEYIDERLSFCYKQLKNGYEW